MDSLFLDNFFELSQNKDIDEEVEKLFSYYRELGFPNYERDRYDLRNELLKLKNSVADIYNDERKTISQSMVGLGVLWTYFPHWIEVKCGGSDQSLAEKWEDDYELRKLIKKTYLWKLKHNELKWTHNRIRQNSKVFMAKQSVSNFRPSVAKYIYDTYGKRGSVFDMSSGYGGRFLGFCASNCKEYVGIEPCSKTFIGLNELSRDLFRYIDKKFIFLKQGSEEYIKGYENYFDLCFTSPPYFDTEKYSEEESQSYIKFGDVNSWLNGFLKQTFLNCYKYAKHDGRMIINIADTNKYELEKPCVNIAKSTGWSLVDTLKMELSSISGKGRKTEPIFVFEKLGG